MILNPEKTFGNPFDDKNIIPDNFGRFGDDVVAKLKQNNNDGDYTPIIDAIELKMQPLRLELSAVDTTLNIQVVKTSTVDEFIVVFKDYMKTNYVFIAAALGGEKTPAFGEFYPSGKSEYSQITKTKSPTIMARLKTVGEKYKVQLGTTISTQLQEFQEKYKTLRDDQLQGKAAVKTNRADRSVAKKEVEVELIKTIHHIGEKFPGDVAQCMVFFDFNLLYAKNRSKKTAETPKE
jgi:hypothetical protein